MNEVWRIIDGFADLYKVSNFGRVKSFNRGKPKILKERISPNGYRFVALQVGGKKILKSIHRLVAEAFIPNPENKPQVNHINGVKNDNRVENLEWCTRSENIRHAVATGLKASGEDNYNAKITNEQARIIRENPNNLSIAQLAEEFNVSCNFIGAVQRGKTYRHAGGSFRGNLQSSLRLTDDIRNEIRRLYVKRSPEFGCVALGKKFNCHPSTISNIVREIQPPTKTLGLPLM